MKKITAFLCLLFIAKSLVYTQGFEGGDGTNTAPWEIATPTQLNMLRNYLGDTHADKHFILINDIDLIAYLADGGDGYALWGDVGWLPIGDWSNKFQGHFDGNDYSIKGLMINRSEMDKVGFFGVVENGTIKNTSFLGINIVGENEVGALVGYCSNRNTISNLHCEGTITGKQEVGGMIGVLVRSSVINCTTKGIVNGTEQNTGGLIGNSVDGIISDSHASATVNGSHIAGGLVGYNMGYNNEGRIENSFATGDVNGTSSAGGLIGVHNSSTLNYSFATGNVTISGMQVGGLIGVIYQNAVVTNCYALGNVTTSQGLAGQMIGGLVGYIDKGSVKYSYATGDLSGGYSLGGIAGVVLPDGVVENCYWNLLSKNSAFGVGNNLGTESNIFGMVTPQMKGNSAAANMTLLNFTNDWETVDESDSDAAGNGYPILRSISRTEQWRTQHLLPNYLLALTANPEAGGIISGAGTYTLGEATTISATPTAGYNFINWTDIDENVISTEASFSYTMPANDVVLVANFELIDYQLSLNVNPMASGIISGAGTYTIGKAVTISATPTAGYNFINWTDIDENIISTEASFSYTMPANDVVLVANFGVVTFLNKSENEKLLVWPNPFDKEINIIGEDKNKRISIVAQKGDLVFETTQPVSQIQTSNFNSGVYFLMLEDEKGQITSYKLIKN